ncbi:MAG: glycerophosphodiester phosphodiesterase, partial [Calditrichaeota bacterium]|nr:glycerophosphodiester phosphodiesterase [Calditrichota bacterium]
ELVKGKIKVCVEIKVKDIEEAVLDCINKLDMRNDVIIFSFDYPVVERIREMDKEIQTLFLKSQADQSTIDAAKAISANAIGVGSKTEITRSFLDAAHQSGIEVWQWTIDDPEKMKELFRLGIDGLITNHPDQALNLIKSE